MGFQDRSERIEWVTQSMYPGIRNGNINSRTPLRMVKMYTSPLSHTTLTKFNCANSKAYAFGHLIFSS